jgi:subfamily B ATP-binding cassette protein HlyB/CyaB
LHADDTAPVSEHPPGATAITCLLLMMRFFRLPADPQRLFHQFGGLREELDSTALVRAARQLGLKADLVTTSWDRLSRTPLPAVAELKDGRFVVMAGAAADKVLVQDPAEAGPREMPRTEFEQRWSRRLVLLASRARIAGDDRPFDFTWFIPSIVKYRRLFGEVLAASFFLQLFALVSPLFFQVVIDKVLVHRSLSTLDVLVFGLVAVAIFEAILGGLRTYVFTHTTNRVDVELGARLFAHLLALPLAYFGARRVGDSVARARELENIRSFLTGSTVTVVVDLVFAFVFVAVMFFYSPTLTWIALGALPFYVALSFAITPALRRRLEEKFQRGAENQAFLVETVTGVETVKAMAVEPQLQRRWEEQLAGYVGAAFRASNLANVANQSTSLINHVTTAVLLWVGARLAVEGTLTVGELVAFNMLSGRLSAPILRLANLWQEFQQVRISVERLGDILNTRRESAAGAGRSGVPAIRGDIEFDRTTFRYRFDGPEVLHQVSLRIPAGQIVGIVGPSGSGKSTLAKLAQRTYVPESGRVLIDGMDIGLLDPALLRRQMGVVLQENVLFTGTIRDNIALSDPGMPMERIVEAAKLAGAHEFILELPNGYDTPTGERGASPSRARWSPIRASCCSTKRPARWTPNRSACSRTTWGASARGAR